MFFFSINFYWTSAIRLLASNGYYKLIVFDYVPKRVDFFRFRTIQKLNTHTKIGWEQAKKFMARFFNVLFIEFELLSYPHQIVIINFNYFILFFSVNALQNIIEITSVDNNNFPRISTYFLLSKFWKTKPCFTT